MSNSPRRVPAWLGSLLCGLITSLMFFAALAAGDQTGAGKSRVAAEAGGPLRVKETHASAFRHVMLYAVPGRFGGWPANHGLWSWGNEILVGFSAGYYKDLGDRHHIDRERPEEHLLARSLDGGEAWAIENPAAQSALIPVGKALHGVAPPGLKEKPWRDCPGGIDFTHPDFAMTARMTDVATGPSRFYCSTNRGHHWEGPFRLPLFGQLGVAARTDYLVYGPGDCLLFLTASNPDGEEGRPFCARTTDGGRTWKFVSWINENPKGYAIMPSTVGLRGRELLTAIRRRDDAKAWIETYRSLDRHALETRHYSRARSRDGQSAKHDAVEGWTRLSELRSSRPSVWGSCAVEPRRRAHLGAGNCSSRRRWGNRRGLPAHGPATGWQDRHYLLLPRATQSRSLHRSDDLVSSRPPPGTTRHRPIVNAR